MKKQIDSKVAIFIIAVFAVMAAVVTISNYGNHDSEIVGPIPAVDHFSFYTEGKDIKKFASEEEFKSYLQEAGSVQSAYLDGGFGMGRGVMMKEMAVPPPMAATNGGTSTVLPDRVSQTNVQVLGIDEPDIVKTDSKNIYFSTESRWYGPFMRGAEPMMDQGISAEMNQKIAIMPPYQQEAGAKVIKAFPPADLAVESKINKSGNLLLYKNNLTVFSNNEITGFDVSDSKAPKEKWNLKFENNNSLVSSRLYGDKIYVVLKNYINESHPCPFKPMIGVNQDIVVGCADIYHPIVPVRTDSVFVALVLDPVSGTVRNKISFVGSADYANSSIIYMSENALYVTYSYQESAVKFLAGFIGEKGQGLIPGSIVAKIQKLDGYDISEQSKLTELQSIFGKYSNSLSDDDRLKLSNEMTNRLADYSKAHKRDMEKTGIVKVGLQGFKVEATGAVPGYPLNQFSLDEYAGDLRIATTVGENNIWLGFTGTGGRSESVNDVYVLSKDLSIQGSVKDLGKTERIYSVRFINDKGYLVTFRQTDPFYVLDLSDPKNPELKGELKIPGYSSYLHPIAKNMILGVGKENWQVKISLFDVSSAAEPKEIAKYTLDESWTEVENNFHAFLQDEKHGVFFIPGSKGGYIFSYKGNKLELVKAVSQFTAKRAIYINDYLYIIGDAQIVVLNESDWSKVKELQF